MLPDSAQHGKRAIARGTIPTRNRPPSDGGMSKSRATVVPGTGLVAATEGDMRGTFLRPLLLRKGRFAGASHAGGGTRTPDTRIMIPLRVGSTDGFERAGGHERGHLCTRHGDGMCRFRSQAKAEVH
jgi:hypothetical protein